MELEGALLLRTGPGGYGAPRRGESGGRIKGETFFANKSLGNSSYFQSLPQIRDFTLVDAERLNTIRHISRNKNA